ARPRRPAIDWKAIPPPRVASAAISVGVILLFLANLLVALGEVSGTAGNVRLLQFLSPADLAVAAVMVVAVFLAGRPPHGEGAPSPLRFLGAEDVRLIAGFVSVAVAAAAVVRAIVVLTISREHVVLKLGNMVDALAAALVAAAAAYWALATK
ncbi:MAG: hypothetical protein ACRDZ8_07995, partial [Acidimicrobiales bacterium]